MYSQSGGFYSSDFFNEYITKKCICKKFKDLAPVYSSQTTRRLIGIRKFVNTCVAYCISEKNNGFLSNYDENSVKSKRGLIRSAQFFLGR